ncbi:MAG: hypothetical protein U0670_08500 [Anaerolineae bacterium]
MKPQSIPLIAWDRLKVITSIVGDIQGRLVSLLLYFTILVPFGLLSTLLSDPLHRKGANMQPKWMDRPPVENELDAAMRQG